MKRLLQFLFASALGGCILETPVDNDEENQRRLMEMESKSNFGNSQQVYKEGCRLTSNQSCINGAMIASPELTLNEQTYFDAEEIGYHIPKMLRLNDETLGELNIIDYSIEFVPMLNNHNFAQGFSIYLKGPKVEQARSQRDGSFQFDHLNPGEYEIRAQKSFSLSVKGLDHNNKEFQRTICLTVFSDKIKVELRPRVTPFLSIEDYYMKLNSTQCPDSEDPLPLVIDF